MARAVGKSRARGSIRRRGKSLQRQASFATRKAKSHHGETREELLERVDAQLRAEVAGGLAQVAHNVLDLAGETPPAEQWSQRR